MGVGLGLSKNWGVRGRVALGCKVCEDRKEVLGCQVFGGGDRSWNVEECGRSWADAEWDRSCAVRVQNFIFCGSS